jgi:D-psicose/D-tagatose/L-ribulose 3-epimerase
LVEIPLLDAPSVDAPHTHVNCWRNTSCRLCVVRWGCHKKTGRLSTQKEYDNLTKALVVAAKHVKSRGIQLGIEPVKRYENHLINTGKPGVELIERVGADNMFLHLDTYHMSIEEKGAGNGILDARKHLKYMHLSESDRGTPGYGTVDWDEIFSTLAAVNCKGVLAMESFINMRPEIAYGLAIWRPVAKDMEEVMENGLQFLRNKARQYGLM